MTWEKQIMTPVFVDLHIHTSDNPNNLNESYDLALLKNKIDGLAEGSPCLISLTDHNTVNKPVYLRAVDIFKNIILGAEIHVRNYDAQKPYHCHVFFKLKQIDELFIDGINKILDNLYPAKVVSADDPNIPRLEDIMQAFDSYDFILLPHGGQNHSTFDRSFPGDVQFDNSLERSIYYNCAPNLIMIDSAPVNMVTLLHSLPR